ncbi:hypothetical protein [Candidatus Neomicrothrix sp.]|uniref:hypothetical protein n=1 Tax=Candidatus Neomicrothrix sp. TaxID=2719034 RepID=UPI0025C53EA0|nr:hypothetical protein [Candidatus Microthrix sp.]
MGQRMLSQYAFGPNAGSAMNHLVSYADECFIGANIDPVAVPDPDVLMLCIEGLRRSPVAQPCQLSTRACRPPSSSAPPGRVRSSHHAGPQRRPSHPIDKATFPSTRSAATA